MSTHIGEYSTHWSKMPHHIESDAEMLELYCHIVWALSRGEKNCRLSHTINNKTRLAEKRNGSRNYVEH